MTHTRRSFIKNAVAVSATFPLLNNCMALENNISPSEDMRISIFSKHLQFLDWKEAGAIAAEIGFDGVDLTVRPKGHVLPKNVLTDLPTAIKDIKESGLPCNMITTSIESATKQVDIDVIKTAGQNGVSFYRSNWFTYFKDRSMQASLEKYKEDVYQLGNLNKQHGIVGCYQNHAGTKIGSSYWELEQLFQKVDPKYFGTQYDIRHATVDGGLSWENGLRLLKEHIKIIALKDFKWGKENGKWKVVNVPIGEGMVDFNKYFKLLKYYGLNPPASMHVEYPMGGADKGKYTITIDKKIVYDNMRNDLTALRKLWREA